MNSQLIVYKYYRDFVGCERIKKILIDSFTLQLNCSRLFYNLLLSVSVPAPWGKVTPLSKPLGSNTKMYTNPQRSDACLSPSSLPANAACQVGVENEWNLRSSVDKIRGERRDGRRHERRSEKNIEVSLLVVFKR